MVLYKVIVPEVDRDDCNEDDAVASEGFSCCTVDDVCESLVDDGRTGALVDDGRTGALVDDGRTGALVDDGRTGALVDDGRTGALVDDGRTGALVDDGREELCCIIERPASPPKTAAVPMAAILL